MKHSLKITLLLVSIFFLSQLIGIVILDQYIDIKATHETGKTVIYEETYNISGITPPPIENETSSFIYVLVGVLMGTVLVLLIIKFKKRNLWKIWFFLSVVICLSIAFVPFVKKALETITSSETWIMPITLSVVILLTIFKIYRQNIIVHNATEVFIYGGLAAILVPRINLISATILLILISLYDMYAVWKSKHMVTMATFQSSTKIFAGLLIPYSFLRSQKPGKNISRICTSFQSDKGNLLQPESCHNSPHAPKPHLKSAVLGGGDMAFPLLFSGVVMKTTGSYLNPIIISIVTTIVLFILLMKGKEDKFYPAMPFITLGCFVGYALTLLF